MPSVLAGGRDHRLEGDIGEFTPSRIDHHTVRSLKISRGARSPLPDRDDLYQHRFAEMVNQPPSTVPGKSTRLCRPESRSEIEKALHEITERACRTRIRIRQGESWSLPVLISMNPLSADEDTKISVVVTDRRKDEERLQLQARMLDSVADAVIAVDTGGRIIYWNDAATNTYGWKPEGVMGKPLIDVAVPEMSKKDVDAIIAGLKKGKTWSGECIVHHRDGHTFPIYVSDSPVFDDHGKLVAFLGASHDITERKRAEEMLRESEERFRELAEKAGSIILRFDTGGRITYFNEFAEQFFGFSRNEILGKPAVGTIVPAEDSAGRDLDLMVRDIIANPSQYADNENENIRKNGERIWVRWTNKPIYNPDGSIREFTTIGNDITERVRAEEELKQKNEQLSVLNEELKATKEELEQNYQEVIQSRT
jgi:PAS domain S-box-containing protein